MTWRAMSAQVLPGGGGVQLIFVDWVALEGAHTRGKGDRRFEDQLSAAAGPVAAAAQWEW